MKKIIASLLAIVLTLSCMLSLSACGSTEKNITVVVREQGSGTREAFDKVVTDGEHFLEEKDADGKRYITRPTPPSSRRKRVPFFLLSPLTKMQSVTFPSVRSMTA